MLMLILMLFTVKCFLMLIWEWDLGETWYRGSGYMPEELCQVSPKLHYVSLSLHSDPSPYDVEKDLIINSILQVQRQESGDDFL